MCYKNDSVMQKVQAYLPPDYRLASDFEPEEYFISIGKCKIHIDHYKVSEPKARIIMFHGVGGNGRLLSCAAVPLAKNGFEVVCPDLPLYGYTEYRERIDYQTWVRYGIDIVKYYQRAGLLSTFIFGFSAGGMLAYQISCECESIAGIMVSCILDQRDIEINKRTAIHPMVVLLGKPLMRLTRKVVGHIKVPMKLIGNMKAITNDERLAKLLMKDKRSAGTAVPIGFVYSIMTPIIKIEPELFHACPVLLIHPGDDRWTDIALSNKFYDRLKCEKETVILDGAGHFPIEELGLRQLEAGCVRFLNKNL